MKFLLTGVLSIGLLVGCQSQPEQSFEDFADDFYVEMFRAGEQSEEVTEMYDQMVAEYDAESSDELYEALTGMYEALDSGASAEGYRQQVASLLGN
ncbi:hypothetical protein ACFQWC_14375 [Rossellomorea sp. GCM10028870]|uniref:hypothetical protein n=1 Tax=Rossellomorea sp. GCM10028870 TaxID=3273426 RepID=UPI00360D4EDD